MPLNLSNIEEICREPRLSINQEGKLTTPDAEHPQDYIERVFSEVGHTGALIVVPVEAMEELLRGYRDHLSFCIAS